VAPGVAQPLQTGEEFQKLGFLPGTLAEILGDGRYQGIFVVPQEGFEGIQAAAPGGEIGERFAPAGGMNLTEQGEEGGRCLLGRVPLGGGMGHTIVLIFE
jgi:hypothetical protein